MSEIKFRKNNNIPSLRELENPYADKSFEEITGEKFEREVNYKIVDLGNGYAKTVPISSDSQ